MSFCLQHDIAEKLTRLLFCAVAPQSAPAMKYTVWANGIFMPDYSYAEKQNKQQTNEQPATPKQVSLRRCAVATCPCAINL
jgi:hypothetical protein